LAWRGIPPKSAAYSSGFCGLTRGFVKLLKSSENRLFLR